MQELRGKTAVVIGAGSGIGRGISLGLAAEGMRVVIADIDVSSATAVRQELHSKGGSSLAASVDATDRDSLEALASLAASQFGEVNLMVNTVGAIVDRPLERTTEEDWAWLIELNLMAQVRSVDVFLPRLRRASDWAHIVTTSSMGGLVALPPEHSRGFHAGIYATTKHALVAYSEMLRMELAAEGIGVSVLCPTHVEGNLQSTSSRNRPAKFGGPIDTSTISAPGVALMPSEAVGPIVVRGLKANRFFIFTHPDAVALVDDRHQQLLADAAFYRQ